MNYLQIGVLVILGIIALMIWWFCLVDLNKDVTFHNRKYRKPRPSRTIRSTNTKPRQDERVKAPSRTALDMPKKRGPQRTPNFQDNPRTPVSRSNVSPFPKGKGGRRG